MAAQKQILESLGMQVLELDHSMPFEVWLNRTIHGAAGIDIAIVGLSHEQLDRHDLGVAMNFAGHAALSGAGAGAQLAAGARARQPRASRAAFPQQTSGKKPALRELLQLVFKDEREAARASPALPAYCSFRARGRHESWRWTTTPPT